MDFQRQYVVKSFLFFILIWNSIITMTSSSQSPNPNPGFATPTSDHAAMIGRIEASIMGESALIDRETGRVYWEGGSSNTLYESLAPRLDQYGAEHAKAAILTGLITLAFIGVLVGWIRKLMEQSNFNANSHHAVMAIVWVILEWTILRFPRLENKWLILATLVLYGLESYNCSTRRFLANAISSPDEVEVFIEKLRKEQPIVTWKVKSYHYEQRKIFQALPRPLRKYTNLQNSVDEILPPRRNTPPMFPFTKKVVSHQATASYQFKSCFDSTIAGVWKKAEVMTSGAAPFTKIVLTKLLVLSNQQSREDYFKQQSEFVTQYGRGDEFVVFSTDIQVSGFKPQVLAVRSVEGIPSTKLFRLQSFWMFTCIGMTVPYRIWFARHCDYLRVSVVKETSNSPVAPVGDSSFRSWFSSQSSALEESLFRSIMQGLSLYNRETLLKDRLDEKSPIGDSTPSATTLVETSLEDDVI